MALLVFPVAGPARNVWSDTFSPTGHQGEDIFAPKGTAVVAVDDGDARNTTDPKGGNVVYLTSGDGDVTYYAHLDSWEIPGGAQGAARVRRGETIGYVGDTGNAAGKDPHLHFEYHPQGGRAASPAALLHAAQLPAPRAGKIAPSTLATSSPALLAKALLAAWTLLYWPAAAPEPGISYALAQLLAEGTLDPRYKGTNNCGSMHATSAWQRAHAADPGYGYVAFMDSGQGGYYIAPMMVFPSLLLGAGAFLELTARNVDLKNVSTTSAYALQQYVAGYFTMGHAPVTPLRNRRAAAAADQLTDADKANIREYAEAMDRSLPGARLAIAAAPSEPRDPAAKTVGPPFATLAERLTSTAPRTIDHARALLGKNADRPPPGAISLDDAIAHEGVWLFPMSAPVPKPKPEPVPKPKTAPSSGSTGSALAILAAALVGVGGVALAARSDHSRTRPQRRAA